MVKMERTLRCAVSDICGRCSTNFSRSPSSLRRGFRIGAALPTYSSRSAHSKSPSELSKRTPLPRTSFSARGFNSSTKAESEEAAAKGATGHPSLKLSQDDLFHSFTNSPVPDFRRRAAFMRQHAYCPHPDHQPTKMQTIAPKSAADESKGGGDIAPAHVDFECPDCGFPVYCSQEHWMDDYDKHLEICDTLRQINEDEHDLMSGRVFTEANVPDTQNEDALINMSNWDTFMYTRSFEAVNSDRAMRQITRLLTYPVTIGSVLHEMSPYGLHRGGRLTPEGLKSFSGTPFNACTGLGLRY